MKFIFDGISIDLLLGKTNLSTIPPDFDIMSPSILRNVERNYVRQINGPRVAELIMSLVPNINNFKLTLRAVKLWAQNRARVCQLYPNAAPSTLFSRFFFVYDRWEWPHPVQLNEIVEDEGVFADQVWDQRNPKGQDLMPVITPTYPAMNCTYNVTVSSLAVMKKEFRRGLKVCNKIELGTADWSLLFEPINFLSLYRHYLLIEIRSSSEDGRRLHSGFVESRMKKIITKLEITENVKHCHPWPSLFRKQ
ncbi:hypothetical protein GEMRC1_004647 [Eukaryota sp. GEM-RC1]